MTLKHTSRILLPLGALLAVVALAPTPARADHGDCGQPQSSGKAPKTSDALVVLKVSVGTGTCGEDDGCDECDVDDSGTVTPGDALVVLRSAVGFSAHLACASECGVTATTLDTTTTTLDTTTTTLDTTTTTLDTTTTTLVGDQDDDNGQETGDNDQGEHSHH